MRITIYIKNILWFLSLFFLKFCIIRVNLLLNVTPYQIWRNHTWVRPHGSNIEGTMNMSDAAKIICDRASSYFKSSLILLLFRNWSAIPSNSLCERNDQCIVLWLRGNSCSIESRKAWYFEQLMCASSWLINYSWGTKGCFLFLSRFK